MNRKSVIAIWLITMAIGRPSEAAEIRPITGADNVLAVYVEDHQYLPGPARLVVAVWHDGFVVWSEDRIAGGAPYRSGRVNPENVAAVLAQMKSDGTFTSNELERPILRFHPIYTTILLRSDGRQLRMRSEHELQEMDGQRALTHDGRVSYVDLPRLRVLSGEPAAYLYFRMAWAETRLRIASLIPSTSDPHQGELLMRAGVMSWKAGKE